MSTDLNDIFADVKVEGADPFAQFDKEAEIPSESQPENEPEADKPEEGDNTPNEDNIPFHKHPRWIERENELRTLREEKEQMARSLDELNSFKEEVSEKLSKTDAQDSDIPEWFSELYGENQVAWNKYQQHEQAKEAELEERFINRQIQEQQKAQEETNHWNKWVEDGINGLVAKGHKFDRNELIKTMLDYRPTDENNNLDFDAGYRILEATKANKDVPDSAKSTARKQLADTTTKSTGGEKKQKEFMTMGELRNKSWNQL